MVVNYLPMSSVDFGVPDFCSLISEPAEAAGSSPVVPAILSAPASITYTHLLIRVPHTYPPFQTTQRDRPLTTARRQLRPVPVAHDSMDCSASPLTLACPSRVEKSSIGVPDLRSSTANVSRKRCACPPLISAFLKRAASASLHFLPGSFECSVSRAKPKSAK